MQASTSISLESCTFLRQVMPLSGKNIKYGRRGYEKSPPPAPPGGEGSWNDNVEKRWGGARKSPPPAPPRGMGVGMIVLRIVFDVFAFWKVSYPMERSWCWQGADGSSLTIRCLTAAGEGASCQNFRKGLLLFLSKSNLLVQQFFLEERYRFL